MADTSYEESERRQLINEINRLRDREIPSAKTLQKQLEVELAATIALIPPLVATVNSKRQIMDKVFSRLGGKVLNVDIDTSGVQFQLQDLETKYFNLKRVSEASINLTALQKEHSSKFGHFDELRKIALGYIIAVDTHIITEDIALTMVEKSFLNQGAYPYWLAHALMAVAKWVSNKKEDCNLEVKNSLSERYLNSCLFYLFTCLRFGRIDAAKKWFLAYLDKVDIQNVGNEWQYVLQAYLYGVFGVDKEFQNSVEDYIQNLFDKVYSTTVDFNEKFETKAYNFINGYAYKTDADFQNLHRYCEQYEELIKCLSDVEKYKIIYSKYDKLFKNDKLDGVKLAQRIENVLYSLINSYEDRELILVQQIKYNEFIINSKGDMTYAQKSYDEYFSDVDENKDFGSLLLDWAFAEQIDNIDPWVQKFAISSMKEPIMKGFVKYKDEVDESITEKVSFNIDDCHIECDENGYEEGCKSIDKQYKKITAKTISKDKNIKIYSLVAVIAVALLLFQIFSFNPTILTFGILGLVGSGLLIWKRVTDILYEVEQLKNATIKKFKESINELKEWREVCKKNIEFSSSLFDIIKNF